MTGTPDKATLLAIADTHEKIAEAWAQQAKMLKTQEAAALYVMLETQNRLVALDLRAKAGGE